MEERHSRSPGDISTGAASGQARAADGLGGRAEKRAGTAAEHEPLVGHEASAQKRQVRRYKQKMHPYGAGGRAALLGK